MSDDKPDLDAAYALNTPDDSRRLYAAWADTYDSDFATQQDYRLHKATARAFVEAGGAGPVLDVGAGTGLCAEVLAGHGIQPIDGTDISADMLAIAETKGVYRKTIVADITKGFERPAREYAGIVSSGTFTTGHVGPGAIDHLLDLALPNALLVLSIKGKHYASEGFEAKLASLSDRIQGLILKETRIYGPNAEGPHKDDTALLAIFSKA
ncbi:MAG: class I SAM-dependent methyltransferase [Pseudomonadota bacterium]